MLHAIDDAARTCLLPILFVINGMWTYVCIMDLWSCLCGVYALVDLYVVYGLVCGVWTCVLMYMCICDICLLYICFEFAGILQFKTKKNYVTSLPSAAHGKEGK